jgi:hypothetical protein
MLEAADSGYLVAARKRSAGVAAYLSATPGTNIRQMRYSPCKYEGIEEARSIWP